MEVGRRLEVSLVKVAFLGWDAFGSNVPLAVAKDWLAEEEEEEDGGLVAELALTSYRAGLRGKSC